MRGLLPHRWTHRRNGLLQGLVQKPRIRRNGDEAKTLRKSLPRFLNGCRLNAHCLPEFVGGIQNRLDGGLPSRVVTEGRSRQAQ